MAELTATFEVAGKSSGDAILTTDTGALSQWDAKSQSPTYSSTAAHGSLGARFFDTGSGAGHLVWRRDGIWTDLSDFYVRFYIYMHAMTGGNVSAGVRHLDAAGNPAVAVYVGGATDGKIRVLDKDAATVGTSTAGFSYDAWHRVEYHVVHAGASSTIDVRMYDSPDSTTITETVSLSSKNFLAETGYISFGNPGGYTANADFFMDSIVAGATAWPGPDVVPSPVADFQATTPTTIGSGETVTFEDLSTNTPTSWLWEKSSDGGASWQDFQSGGSHSQNPTEAFT